MSKSNMKILVGVVIAIALMSLGVIIGKQLTKVPEHVNTERNTENVSEPNFENELNQDDFNNAVKAEEIPMEKGITLPYVLADEIIEKDDERIKDFSNILIQDIDLFSNEKPKISPLKFPLKTKAVLQSVTVRKLTKDENAGFRVRTSVKHEAISDILNDEYRVIELYYGDFMRLEAQERIHTKVTFLINGQPIAQKKYYISTGNEKGIIGTKIEDGVTYALGDYSTDYRELYLIRKEWLQKGLQLRTKILVNLFTEKEIIYIDVPIE